MYLKNKKITIPAKDKGRVLDGDDTSRTIFEGGQKISSDWVGRSIGTDISKFTKGRKEKTPSKESGENEENK